MVDKGCPLHFIVENNMKRRNFLIGLTLISALSLLPLTSYARESELTIGIFPGTGTADLPLEELQAGIAPFIQALTTTVGLKPKLTIFRTIKNVTRSLEKGRLDVYFVPPTVAINVLDNGYVPVARVKDPQSGTLVRVKGATVKAVALGEKQSWLDVMGRHVLKLNKLEVEIVSLKTQEDVVLAMEHDYAQAGALSPKLANELVAKGSHEIWYPLPPTPGFTLMASDRLSEDNQNKLGAAAVALQPDILQPLQKVITGKVTGFVVDKQADYKTLKLAFRAAGY